MSNDQHKVSSSRPIPPTDPVELGRYIQDKLADHFESTSLSSDGYLELEWTVTKGSIATTFAMTIRCVPRRMTTGVA